MNTLNPHEARAAVAARVADQLAGSLRESAEPYAFLRAGLRSMAPSTFAVGRGKAEPDGARQRTDEGVRTITEVRVLVALQAQAAAHLALEDAMGEICAALRVALCADWRNDLAVVWAGDAEPVATETLVRFECLFACIHQTPLE